MGCVNLTVPLDDVFDVDEVFTVTLTSDDEGVTIAPNVSMVTITDTTGAWKDYINNLVFMCVCACVCSCQPGAGDGHISSD